MDLSKSIAVGTRKVNNLPLLKLALNANFVATDGELCLDRVKPEETLVEARSGSDVQIDRQIWV
jgi:hypothetical protein